MSKKKQQETFREGARLMGAFFEGVSDMLREQQEEIRDAEKAQATRRKRLDEKRKEFEKEWQRRNPRGT